MFETLTDKLGALLKRLRGRGVLTEADIDEALKEVRRALLEADVHFSVVKSFVESVRARAVGVSVLESLTPGLQVVKIVHETLTQLIGEKSKGIEPAATLPTLLMLVGLQGSGKTTTAAKIARFYQSKGKRVLLVAADLHRPAAVDQLRTHASTLKVPLISPDGDTHPLHVAKRGMEVGKRDFLDMVIVDTAGRHQVDTQLMDELATMKSAILPHEILFVADAMTGQIAVNVAKAFHEKLTLTGVVLTKTEGDARSGALLSIRQMTGVPVRFLGTGETLDALDVCYPDRMASRILGMGDALSLIEKAESNFTRESAQLMAQKIRSNRFTLNDFRVQMQHLKGWGSLDRMLEMIPGVGRLQKQIDASEVAKEMKQIEAIISSMTPGEREAPEVIDGSRRRRIARGSGTSVQEINRLLKQFQEAKKMMKQFSSGRKWGGGRLGMSHLMS